MSTRISFELELTATDAKHAKHLANFYISRFLSIPESEVDEKVSIELKVEINESSPSNDGLEFNYKVTVFGSLKNQFIFP